jgi:hypothetical protein
MDEGSQATLLAEVAAGFTPNVAALVKERITPEELRDLTMQAAVHAARHRDPDDTMSEGTMSELRRLILLRLSESTGGRVVSP